MKKKIKYPEGGDVPIQTASLYQRLVDNKLIDPSISETTFGSLPKAEIDKYFQSYKQLNGGITQSEADAIPGKKTLISHTIFTGTQEKTDFNSAFSQARNSGLQTFNYNGKDYTTEVDPNFKSTSSANTQTKSDYMVNIAGKNFAAGGNLANVAGILAPIANFIPGVGPIVSTGLNMVSKYAPLLDKTKTEDVSNEILPVNQGLYGMAKGGNLAGRKKYFKGGFEAEGGEVMLGKSDINQSNKSSVGGVIEGNSHSEGGVDGSTGDYILSDRFGIDGSYEKDNPNSLAKKAQPIMKAISKTEKRTGDNIDRLTVGMLKNKIKNFKILNDKFLEQEKVKETFAAGGPLSGLIDFSKDAIYDYEINQNLANDYDNPFIEPIVPDVNTPRFSSHIGNDNLVTGAGGVQPRVSATGRGAQIIPPINDEKLGGLTGLDIAGMGVSALGAGFQFANTINEFNKNKELNPNTNYYNDISARAEGTYQESLDTLNREKMQSARDINESYSPLLTTQQSNSVNVDRAVKANAYANRSKNIGMSNLSYDSAIAQGKQGLAGLQMQGDTLDAQGKFQVNEAKQMDLANYFSSLGVNAADATNQAINAIGIAQNAKSQSQALMLLKDSMPNYTLEQLNGILSVIFKK